MIDEIKKVQFDNEFQICPDCGYKGGFHMMLKKDKDK